MMKVGLFVPCYIDQFYPQVAVASLELLEKQGCEVCFPLNQTCCGQPMANSGFAVLSKGCDTNFVNNFAEFDYIVAPSGSCVLHVKEHLNDAVYPDKAAHIRSHIYELTEFLTDVLKVEKLTARFPFKVGFHNSCHGQRGRPGSDRQAARRHRRLLRPPAGRIGRRSACEGPHSRISSSANSSPCITMATPHRNT